MQPAPSRLSVRALFPSRVDAATQCDEREGGEGVFAGGPSGPTKKEAALEAKWDRKHLGKRLQEEDAHEADWDEAAAVAKNLKGLTVEQILENIMGMGYKVGGAGGCRVGSFGVGIQGGGRTRRTGEGALSPVPAVTIFT